MVTESAVLAEPEALSVTLAIKLEEPAAVGVPEIMPPARLNPDGSDPLAIDHEYGALPPVAWSACEYVTPTGAPFATTTVTPSQSASWRSTKSL